jgi:hypothetical protein
MALLSIKVADAEDGHPIAALIHDLEHLTHDDAAAHYGRSKGCHYRAWTRESEHGRDDFAEFLADVEDGARHLREFDEARRPVAIAHWWLAEAGNA